MIKLYTASTPNGRKASIALEEMDLEYEVKALDLSNKEQKQDWYLQINPNGRIPAIIDTEADDFAVFESGAILLYLAEKTGKFLSTDVKERSRTHQWLMFQMAGVGPMQGQLHVFENYAPEKIPYAIERYKNETRRLYEVLEKRLERSPFLAGDDYSIADMAVYPWAHAYATTDSSIEDFPDLRRWYYEISERKAVEKGMNVPEQSDDDKNKTQAEKQESVRSMLV